MEEPFLPGAESIEMTSRAGVLSSAEAATRSGGTMVSQKDAYIRWTFLR